MIKASLLWLKQLTAQAQPTENNTKHTKLDIHPEVKDRKKEANRWRTKSYYPQINIFVNKSVCERFHDGLNTARHSPLTLGLPLNGAEAAQ